LEHHSAKKLVELWTKRAAIYNVDEGAQAGDLNPSPIARFGGRPVIYTRQLLHTIVNGDLKLGQSKRVWEAETMKPFQLPGRVCKWIEAL